jgi:hypothetical protein
MMSESMVREWRDREQERVAAICNPYHRKKASDLLNTLNAILQEG